jgi:hypothetical protein
VLFSQDRVAKFINAHFEPTWESVRPVPLVRIDFGNGTVLTRTLHGNILTSVCTPEGQVLDALPGIYTPDAYLDRLEQLRLLAGYTRLQAPAKRPAFVRAYHLRQVAALKKGKPPEVFVAQPLRMAFRSKSRIELPLEKVLQAGVAPRPVAQAARKGAAQLLARVPKSAYISKSAIEVPVEKVVTMSREDLAFWVALEEDTRLNEGPRRRQIHAMLGTAGLARPAKVTRPIYKEVLHADLDDPYLGLGKALFGTYPFAEEDKGK